MELEIQSWRKIRVCNLAELREKKKERKILLTKQKANNKAKLNKKN